MKKLSSVFLSAALLLCTCAACAPSAERQVRMENPPAETVSGAEQEVFDWTQLSDKSVSSESAEYVRGAAEVAEAAFCVAVAGLAGAALSAGGVVVPPCGAAFADAAAGAAS